MKKWKKQKEILNLRKNQMKIQIKKKENQMKY